MIHRVILSWFFSDGEYNYLKYLNVTHNITIKANNVGKVKITGDGTNNLFNINASHVTIIGLNISNFNTAINSTADNLRIILQNV